MFRKAKPEEDIMAIPDSPDRHAFVMLGRRTLFLCHLTMFHMENHCYQIVVEAGLPDHAMAQYVHERETHPDATYFLGNLEQDLWTVPQLQNGARRGFLADIWRGIPYQKEYTEWPWNHQRPVISSIPVTVTRVVFYRHFDFNLEHPQTLSYMLFGAGNEAFLTKFQVKEPDFDQVVTLARNPVWLPQDQLRAGVPINIPSLKGGLHCTNPLAKSDYQVQYGGFPEKRPALTIQVARSEWFCTKVVNSENPCPDESSCEASPGTRDFQPDHKEQHYGGKS